jgi:hypothetical protein
VTFTNPVDAGAVNSTWSGYQEVTDGTRLDLPARALSDGGTLPPGTNLYRAHPGYADFVQLYAGFEPNTPGIDDLHAGLEIATRIASPAGDGAQTIDLSELSTLPALIGTTVDTTIPTQPAIGWTTGSGTLAASTGVIALALWSGTVTGDAGTSQQGTWTLVSPGTSQTSLRAPALPAGSAWAPGNASFDISTLYAVQGGTVLPSYTQLRATASLFTLQTACINAPMAPPLPANGTLGVSGFTSGACP